MTLHKWLDPLVDGGAAVAELLDPAGPRPPEVPGVYVVTFGMEAAYVGMTETQTLKDRIGDLVSTMLGLYTKEGAPHAGGRTLLKEFPWEARAMMEVHWMTNLHCIPCWEHHMWWASNAEYNKKAPTCPEHPLGQMNEDKYALLEEENAD